MALAQQILENLLQASDKNRVNLGMLIGVGGLYSYACQALEGTTFDEEGEVWRVGYAFIFPYLVGKSVRVQVMGHRLASGRSKTCEPLTSPVPWEGTGKLTKNGSKLKLEYNISDEDSEGTTKDTITVEQSNLRLGFAGEFEQKLAFKNRVVRGKMSYTRVRDYSVFREFLCKNLHKEAKLFLPEAVDKADWSGLGDALSQVAVEADPPKAEMVYVMTDLVTGTHAYSKGEDSYNVVVSAFPYQESVIYERRIDGKISIIR